MQELEQDGLLVRGERRKVRKAGRLPSVAVLDIVGLDAAGELLARPATKAERETVGADERVLLLETGSGRGPAPEVGDRILSRLKYLADGSYEARIIKILPRPAKRLVGVLERLGRRFLLRPLTRKAGRELPVDPATVEGLEPGDLVVAEPAAAHQGGVAKVIERLGQVDDPAAISLLATFHHELPTEFPEEAIAAAEAAAPAELGTRQDLRDLPLVTIDGADARDFDDAVFARPDDDPDNPEGWRITVAIADVAHYVHPGGALDREAQERGNSVYFPDRVLPMLPEALSNGLCSLRPGEDRACMAVHIWLDQEGRKRRHRFSRALMRSAARLTYEEVQAARDGRPGDQAAALQETVIRPLYGAFEAILQARRKRGTLDLDIPELQLELDDQSRPTAIVRRARLDAHRLIEEFMIIANVAAAETLEKAKTPCMYRVHDRPDAAKLEALGQFLQSLGITKNAGLSGKQKDLARLLELTREHPLSPLVSSLLLRAQSQAVYAPHNLGHYGLNLSRYAHFTSPIRRYADLVVHRGLIRALKLGAGALPAEVEIEALEEIGGHISGRERRAMEAERAAKDRFVAAFMADQVGAVFAATITSVHRFGLFVQLEGSLADALVPISTLSANRLDHDMDRHALIDRKGGEIFSLGDRVRAELVEVDRATGRLAARLVDRSPTATVRPRRSGGKAKAARGNRRVKPKGEPGARKR
jgi:ribonuclease R